MFLRAHHHARLPRSSIATLRTYSTAKIFGDAGAATFLAAASSPESIPRLHGLPEIIVTGRANVGKSTLLNAVLGRRDLLHTSKKPGHTRTLNFFRVGDGQGKLVVVDAPGYGARGRPEWGAIFDHYLETRRTLRRVYILFNGKHPLNRFDHDMLAHLSSKLVSDRGTQTFTLQAVITKADCMPDDEALPERIEKFRNDIWKAAPMCLPPIFTSSSMRPPFGIDEMRKNIADACDLVA